MMRKLLVFVLVLLACRATTTLPVATKLPTPTQKIQQVIKPPTPVMSTVTARESLNVRQGASIRFPVIAVLAHGRQVDVTSACKDGWVQVSFIQDRRHVKGWVNAYYLAGGICQ